LVTIRRDPIEAYEFVCDPWTFAKKFKRRKTKIIRFNTSQGKELLDAFRQTSAPEKLGKTGQSRLRELEDSPDGTIRGDCFSK